MQKLRTPHQFRFAQQLPLKGKPRKEVVLTLGGKRCKTVWSIKKYVCTMPVNKGYARKIIIHPIFGWMIILTLPNDHVAVCVVVPIIAFFRRLTFAVIITRCVG